MFFSKQINRLISKGMSNIYDWEKLTFSKLIGKVNFSERKLEGKKVESIFGETFILALLSSAVFIYKTVSETSFHLFCSGDIKLTHGFEDETVLITKTLISSCHWKTLVPSYFREIRPENTFLTSTVNYRKIVQRKKLCHLKQQ